MVFPQTRVTLIQRLASGGSEEDWGQFLSDYWGPVCRFSLRWGVGTVDDAEDVALPVGHQHCHLSLSGVHNFDGLSMIDGKNAPDNPTRKASTLENGRRYRVLTSVRSSGTDV